MEELGHLREAQSRAKPVELARASGQDAFRMSPLGVVLGMPIREENPGQTKNMLEIIFFSCLGNVFANTDKRQITK